MPKAARKPCPDGEEGEVGQTPPSGEHHLEQTRATCSGSEQVFGKLGAQPRAKKCEAMEGLIAEAWGLMGEIVTPEVLDAAIVTAAQKVEHYEIASYGSLNALAQELGHTDAARLLEQTLNEEKAADQAEPDRAVWGQQDRPPGGGLTGNRVPAERRLVAGPCQRLCAGADTGRVAPRGAGSARGSLVGLAGVGTGGYAAPSPEELRMSAPPQTKGSAPSTRSSASPTTTCGRCPTTASAASGAARGPGRAFGWQPVHENGRRSRCRAAAPASPSSRAASSSCPAPRSTRCTRPAARCTRTSTRCSEVAEPLGIGMLGLGFQPKWRREDIPWMPKGRYQIMGELHAEEGQARPRHDAAHLHRAGEPRLLVRGRHGARSSGSGSRCSRSPPRCSPTRRSPRASRTASSATAATSGPTPIPTAPASCRSCSRTAWASSAMSTTCSTCRCTSSTATAATSTRAASRSATSWRAGCRRCRASGRPSPTGPTT